MICINLTYKHNGYRHERLRRQHSPVPPLTDDVIVLVPPVTDDVDPVRPLEGEAVADAEPWAFGGGPFDLSLLPLYLDHTARHIWDNEKRDPQKFVNHKRKIVALPPPNEDWFLSIMTLSGMKDLCMTGYTLVNHGMLNAPVERWHSKTSLFHLLHGEMSITLDDVSFLLHLPIRGRFFDHGKVSKDKALEMIVEYLGDDPEKAMKEVHMTMGAHARFEFLRNIYATEIQRAEQDDGDC
ncbi:protein MAIN-LIKE 1-like [Lathyrus oleraceus]|uniref:protein MAIN-LIKE 1-like n=1 Tax=Pisum sativum TaxID=3888 RepID=UPI0021CE2F1B|nr:protein MAIN-LIKE 1-like [Pisum sativum]